VHDLLNGAGAKNPANRAAHGIDNSIELFRTQSVHGGLWRCGYTVDSIGEVSALIHWLGGPALFLPVVALLLLVAYGYFAGLL
jgi:hypothetical protein